MGYETKIPAFNKELKKWELKVLIGIGSFVERAAKDLSPEDTANLKNSINYKVDKSDKAVRIGTNVDYAIFQEKGTINMEAQPFLTPALENNINQIKKVVERVKVNVAE